MNATKRARYQSSVNNQPSGGGSKKAGEPSSVGLSQWGRIAYRNHGLPLPLSNLSRNRFSVFPNMNLPVGFNNPIRMR